MYVSIILFGNMSIFFIIINVGVRISLRAGAEPEIFHILGYDINTHKLFFKINHSLEYINLSN
jgi:hypothetical protein